MNEFWQNLKGILVNSPLILSESKDPKDISLHRVAIAVLLVIVLAGPFFTSYIRPEFFDRFTPYWTQVLILIGGLLTSRAANRAIDAKAGQLSQQNGQQAQDQK